MEAALDGPSGAFSGPTKRTCVCSHPPLGHAKATGHGLLGDGFLVVRQLPQALPFQTGLAQCSAGVSCTNLAATDVSHLRSGAIRVVVLSLVEYPLADRSFLCLTLPFGTCAPLATMKGWFQPSRDSWSPSLSARPGSSFPRKVFLSGAHLELCPAMLEQAPCLACPCWCGDCWRRLDHVLCLACPA